MGIRVIRGTNTAALAQALADRFAESTADPFSGEIVVVPTRGIERYLTQTIADRAGICANIAFPSPRELLERLTGDDDPWRPDRLVWPLLATIDASLSQAWAEPLAAHLHDEPSWRRSDRRYALARRLAALFDSYTMERPAMVRRWEAGEPADVPGDLQWQYELWRALRSRVGTGPLEASPDASGLPSRIAVFGPTRLPERFLEALDALGQQRAVELYLPIASPALWDRKAWKLDGARGTDASQSSLAVHPLLRSLGRDAREMRQRLGPGGETRILKPDTGPATLLARLQSEIAGNRESTIVSAEPDPSLQIHAGHGPLRQVEVLREVILTLLHDDPTLQPRDILIMSPDLATYAPLLAAVFGDPDQRIRDLRLSIADRTPEQHNEVLLVIDTLLAMLNGRMRRSDVLDLLKSEAVRSRFDLSADDVLRMEELVEAANVRWGLDAAHRSAIGAGAHNLGSWSWGLDRMALGTALSDDPLVTVGETLPLPDVGSGDIGQIGRLAEFLQRLSELYVQAQGTRTLTAWNVLLQQTISDFTQVRYADAWQDARARGAIERHLALAGDHADNVELSLADIRQMLASVLAGRPTRAGFRLGGMTACQMEPMRSVPYRVIALLGMDDGAFPRKSGRDGDDVLLRQPRIGERDPRSEDRQLLLDAIMAAGQHLIITYTGRDERTNEERHPAVPIAELIDLLPGNPGTLHPLQPFDPRNFAPPTPFSHDTAALAGARVSVTSRTAHDALSAPPMSSRNADQAEAPTLEELVRFLKDPLTDYLRRRFRVSLGRSVEPPLERLPLTLTGLDAWLVGDGILRNLERGRDLTLFERAAALGGSVPPGEAGTACLTTVREQAVAIDAASREAAESPPTSLEVPLPWGAAGTMRISRIQGDAIVRTTYSKKKPSHLLEMWPELLCLRIAEPDVHWRSAYFTKTSKWYLAAPDPDSSRRYLDQLLDLYRRGASSLLPITVGTGYSYANALRGKHPSREDALRRASDAWESERDGENRGVAAQLIFGRDSAFDDLLTEPPHPDEDWYGSAAPHRFEALARRIWDPMLAHASAYPPAPSSAARRKGGRA